MPHIFNFYTKSILYTFVFGCHTKSDCMMCLAKYRLGRVWRLESVFISKKKTDNAMVKTKRTHNDLHNTTQQIKDRATRTQLITVG